MRPKRKGYTLPTLKDVFQVIGVLAIMAVWTLVLFNPVFIAIHYSNPLFLLLYLLLPMEFFVGALLTGFIFAILDA